MTNSPKSPRKLNKPHLNVLYFTVDMTPGLELQTEKEKV